MAGALYQYNVPAVVVSDELLVPYYSAACPCGWDAGEQTDDEREARLWMWSHNATHEYGELVEAGYVQALPIQEETER